MTQKGRDAAIANRILACFTPCNVLEEVEEQYRSFGLQAGIAVSYPNSENYVRALQQLFELKKEIQATYTYKTFEGQVADLAYAHVYNKTQFTQAEVTAFLAKLIAVPVQTQHVLRPIFGVLLRSKEAPYVLGPYSIFDIYQHRTQLMAGLSEKLQNLVDTMGRDESMTEFLPPERDYFHLIRVTVRAREASKALEIADALFERFERVIRFMLGQRISNFEVGVLNYQGRVRKRAVVLGETWSTSERDNIGPTQDLILDDAYFTDRMRGFDKIWENFEKPTTKLAERLLLAVEWIGQSYGERVPSIAFIKAAISLEVLFTREEGAFVTPSIISQLCEGVAFVLGTTPESRCIVEADVKDMYKTRSAIAHAGMTNVNLVDLTAVQQLARSVVMKMFVTPSLNSLSSVDDLYGHFKLMKYSCSPA